MKVASVKTAKSGAATHDSSTQDSALLMLTLDQPFSGIPVAYLHFNLTAALQFNDEKHNIGTDGWLFVWHLYPFHGAGLRAVTETGFGAADVLMQYFRTSKSRP